MCQMSPPDKGEDSERCTCDDITMGRENIKIPVYSGKGIRPPKLIYPRTNYWVPKYIPDEEYKGFLYVTFHCSDLIFLYRVSRMLHMHGWLPIWIV